MAAVSVLFLSCDNFFENDVTEENQTQNIEVKSAQNCPAMSGSNKAEPEPVIVSGQMTISGAVPEEVLPEYGSEQSASRSAVPTYEISQVEYFVTAVSGSRTVDGTFATDQNAGTFSINLIPGLEWDITCGLRKRSSGGTTGEVLFSATKEDVDPATLANNAVLQFFPTPDTSGGSGSTGEIDLSMTVVSAITSVEINCFSSNKNDWPFTSASLSETTASIKTDTTYPSVKSGVYEVIIDFYKSGHVLAYSTVQTINVCKGLKTKKWISSGGITPIEADGTFNITTEKLAAFVNTTFYVGNIASSKAASDSGNNGNHREPFLTLAKAINQIEVQAAASGSATLLPYTIFIVGTVDNTSSLFSSVPELGSSLNGKASKITIKGIANESNPPLVQKASSMAPDRVLNIATTVPVEINGLTITGGKASGTTGSEGYGGGLYLRDEGTVVTLNNTTIEGNYAALQGGGVYIAGGASLIMTGTSQIKENAILRRGAGTGNPDTKGAGGGVYVAEGAYFTLNGGSISGNGSADSGAAVYVRGTFTMNDGLIDSNKYILASNQTNPVLSTILSSATITQNIEIGVPGTFNMKGGTITSSLSEGWNGAGVCIYSSGGAEGTANFNMSGGTITGIKFSSSSHYGAVYLSGQTNCKLIFNMSGGSIRGNTAALQCSGVYVGRYSSFVMTGGEISGNSLISTSDTAGIYLSDLPASGYPKISLGKAGSESTVKIKNNTRGTLNQKSNLSVSGSTLLSIAGPLSAESEIGISKVDGGVFTEGYNSQSSNPSRHFLSDDDFDIILDSSGEAKILLPDYVYVSSRTAVPAGDDESGTGSQSYPFATIERAVERITNNNNPSIKAVIYVTGDVACSHTVLNDTGTDGTMLLAHSLTIEGLGSAAVLYCEDSENVYEKGGILNLNTSVPVTIKNVTLRNGKAVRGGALYIDGSSLILDENTKITNCFAEYGGGLAVENGGSITLDNAVIEANGVLKQGGGVYVGNDSGMIMNGTSSLIKDNGVIGGRVDKTLTNRTAGGGVFIAADASFTMNNGSVEGNIAQSGGAIYVFGNFIFKDGFIKSNKKISSAGQSNSLASMSLYSLSSRLTSTRENYGQGANVEVGISGSFTMKGGTITSDLEKPGQNGAAVNIYANTNDGDVPGTATFNMEGGSITGLAIGANAAVQVNIQLESEDAQGIINMSGGSITNNTYLYFNNNTKLGAAICLLNKGHFIMTGGEISGNNAYSDGGAIYIRNNFSDITLGKQGVTSTVIIKNNTATTNYETNNICFNSLYSNVINIAGPLSAESEIGITGHGVITHGYSLYNIISPEEIFTSDHGGEVSLVDGEVVIN